MIMNRARRTSARRPAVRLALLALSACASSVRAENAALDKRINPPQGVFLDDWMTMDMMGMRVGYAHQEMTRAGDEVQSSMLITISLKRLNTPLTFSMVQSTRESADGAPRAFSNRLDASTQKLETEGTIEGGKVRMRTAQFGQVTQQEYAFPDGALLGWGAAREVLRRGFEPGTKYTLRVYDASISPQTALDMEVRIVGPEELDLDGKKISAIRTEQSTRLPGSVTEMPSTAWYTPDGDVVRMTMNMGGISAVMTKATKEVALKEVEPGEFFAPTLIEAHRHIDRDKTAAIDYILKPKSPGTPMPTMPETGMQHVTATENNTVKLTVRRQDHAALAKIEKPAASPADSEYLVPNVFMNTDDPEVQKMAKEARGDAATPYAVADRLRKFVTEVITEKTMDVAFATASEVCRNKEGDCSEHAVLLGALGRACGLPSRVAAGLVYVPGAKDHRDVFAFHMWTQFLIGDSWVDFDAAQYESDCNPTHIAFSVSSLRDSSLGQLVYGLVGVLGNLDLTIENTTARD